MQNFNYHCHNSFENIFDGKNTVDEMLRAYISKGFCAVGLSNHFICHKYFLDPRVKFPQNFSDVNVFIDVAKRLFDYIDECASKYNIKVYKGFEVDYFCDSGWHKDLEELKKQLNPDYLIGTSHYISDDKENVLYNLYHLDAVPQNISEKDYERMLYNYWHKQILAIKSGYFDFMAHPDYCCQFGLCLDDKWKDIKMEYISALKSSNVACEINTGGLRRPYEHPFPDWWMIKEMIKQEIPLLISDDAHYASDVAANFEDVEEKLKEFNCKKRYNFSK